jgi:ABC-type multidrug transport system ATPase subunit
MFNNFDRLMLLAKGKIVFFNEAKLAVDYFSSINYKCPEMSNPADYFMTIISIESIGEEENLDPAQEVKVQTAEDLRKVQEEYTKKIAYFDECYQRSHLKNDPTYEYQGLERVTSADIANSLNGWCYQLRLLLRRNF